MHIDFDPGPIQEGIAGAVGMTRRVILNEARKELMGFVVDWWGRHHLSDTEVHALLAERLESMLWGYLKAEPEDRGEQ